MRERGLAELARGATRMESWLKHHYRPSGSRLPLPEVDNRIDRSPDSFGQLAVEAHGLPRRNNLVDRRDPFALTALRAHTWRNQHQASAAEGIKSRRPSPTAPADTPE